VASSAGEFGPDILYAALADAGVEFHFIGFITHYAAQRYDRRQQTGAPRPQALSHGDNLDRLARALRSVDAATRTRTGLLEQFTGRGSDVARIVETFETPHGTIDVRTNPHDYSAPLHDGVRIVIGIPIERLRAYVATGRFDDDLAAILRIAELFEGIEPGADRSADRA
jgi:hypothetical protein